MTARFTTPAPRLSATLQTTHVGAERRQLIAIRLDPTVLRWLKSLAAEREVPYQSFINDLLAEEMKKAS